MPFYLLLRVERLVKIVSDICGNSSYTSLCLFSCDFAEEFDLILDCLIGFLLYNLLIDMIALCGYSIVLLDVLQSVFISNFFELPCLLSDY